MTIDFGQMLLLAVPVLWLLIATPLRFAAPAGDGGDAGGGEADPGDTGGDAAPPADETGDGGTEAGSGVSHPSEADSRPPSPAAPQRPAMLRDEVHAALQAAKTENQPQRPQPPGPPQPQIALPPALTGALDPKLLETLPDELRGPVGSAVQQVLADINSRYVQPFMAETLDYREQLNQWAEQAEQAVNFRDQVQAAPGYQEFGLMAKYPELVPHVQQLFQQLFNGGGQAEPEVDPLAGVNVDELDPETQKIFEAMRGATTAQSQQIAQLRAELQHAQQTLAESGERQRSFEDQRRRAELDGYGTALDTQFTDALAGAQREFGFDPRTYKPEWNRATAYMQMKIRSGEHGVNDPIGPLLKEALQVARYDVISARRKKQATTGSLPPQSGANGTDRSLRSEIRGALHSARRALPAG